MRKRESLLLALTAAAVLLMYILAFGEKPRAMMSAETETETETEAADALILRWGGSVDLNTAGAEELTALPGIGETLAGRIVAWRAEHGPFTSLEDLLNVDGVGETTLEKLYEYVEEP